MLTTIEEVKSYCLRVQAEFETVKAEYRHVSQLEQQILHYVEVESYNCADGAKLLKKLKEVRRRRRVLKNEVEELGVIVERVKAGKLLDMKHKPANVYTVSLEEILAG